MIDDLRNLVREDFTEVNSLIISRIKSDVPLIEDVTNHIINSGGKRLRPLIALISAKALGYRGKKHIDIAAMVEFFHTATLLHDDVVDESSLRRGRNTANTIWGSKTSILVGDYLFSQYMKLLVDTENLEIMHLLTEVSHQIGAGEIKQLSLKNSPCLETHEYYEIIKAKTSLLFAAASKSAAIIAKASLEDKNALYEYGLCLGNAFQLIDDALDYCSDTQTLGKNIGDDLKDGKTTLPILHARANSDPNTSSKIENCLKEGDLSLLPIVLAAISETKAIEYTKSQALKEVDKAINAIQHIPNSKYKEGLINLANFAVERSN